MKEKFKKIALEISHIVVGLDSNELSGQERRLIENEVEYTVNELLTYIIDLIGMPDE